MENDSKVELFYVEESTETEYKAETQKSQGQINSQSTVIQPENQDLIECRDQSNSIALSGRTEKNDLSHNISYQKESQPDLKKDGQDFTSQINQSNVYFNKNANLTTQKDPIQRKMKESEILRDMSQYLLSDFPKLNSTGPPVVLSKSPGQKLQGRKSNPVSRSNMSAIRRLAENTASKASFIFDASQRQKRVSQSTIKVPFEYQNIVGLPLGSFASKATGTDQIQEIGPTFNLQTKPT